MYVRNVKVLNKLRKKLLNKSSLNLSKLSEVAENDKCVNKG